MSLIEKCLDSSVWQNKDFQVAFYFFWLINFSRLLIIISREVLMTGDLTVFYQTFCFFLKLYPFSSIPT